jgi:hypothetical protein
MAQMEDHHHTLSGLSNNTTTSWLQEDKECKTKWQVSNVPLPRSQALLLQRTESGLSHL